MSEICRGFNPPRGVPPPCYRLPPQDRARRHVTAYLGSVITEASPMWVPMLCAVWNGSCAR